MSKANNFNDYELVYLITNHNEKALKIFYEKYEEVFKYYLYKNKIGWKDYEFLLDEGRQLIFYCIQVYNGICPFFAFYKLCTIRLIMKYFKKRRIQELNIEGFEFESILNDELQEEPIKFVFKNAIQDKIAEGIMEGKKLNQIAKDLALNPKKVYYEFEKMKMNNQKLKK